MDETFDPRIELRKMSDVRSSASRRSSLRLAALLVAPLALFAACDDSPTDPPAVTNWTADLEGAGEFTEIEGAALVVSTTQSSAAGVEIIGADAGAAFTWYVAAGTCADPGEALGEPGDYDALEANDEGEGAAEAELGVALDNSASYHVAILPSDDADVVAACSALSRS